MLESSRRRILELVTPDDSVLDVGGWADPVGRADWVIDLMPYASRGLYARKGWIAPREEVECFSVATWVERDICDRAPWPFADEQFDFALCSHTLEDVRDPLWVCAELVRVARAGYIELPSRLEEQSWGVEGPFAGWSHHRWLVDMREGSIEFVAKPHAMHARPEACFPAGFWPALSAEERVQSMWWEASFAFAERVFVEEPIEPYLDELVTSELARRGADRAGPRGLRRRPRRRRAGS